MPPTYQPGLSKSTFLMGRQVKGTFRDRGRSRHVVKHKTGRRD